MSDVHATVNALDHCASERGAPRGAHSDSTEAWSVSRVLLAVLLVGATACVRAPATPTTCPPTVVVVRTVADSGERVPVESGVALDGGVRPALGCPALAVFVPMGQRYVSVDILQAFSQDDLIETPVIAAVRPFCLQQHETTVREYSDCVAAGRCERTGTRSNMHCNEGVASMERHPINCVTRRQAEAYCEYAGGRLPSLIEWDYAAAFGGPDDPQRRREEWGDGNLCGLECGGADACQSPGVHFDPYCRTAPVDFGPPSRLGIVAMYGNVSEWTTGLTGNDLLPAGVRATMAGRFREYGWVSGCSFNCSPHEISSYSFGPALRPDTFFDDIGFRCVFEPR